jgi:hypothetical protein
MSEMWMDIDGCNISAALVPYFPQVLLMMSIVIICTHGILQKILQIHKNIGVVLLHLEIYEHLPKPIVLIIRM